MTTATLDAPMAKQRPDRPETTMARVRADLLKEARVAASFHGISLGEYVNRAVRAALDRDEAAIAKSYAAKASRRPRPE